MIGVVLVDDHALVRSGFRMLLSQHPDIAVLGEAGSGEDALPLIRQLKPQVVICDLHLPGISGLDVVERLVRAQSPAKVVVVSVQEDGPLPRRVLEAGALGYISKGCPEHELLGAVRDAARGKRFIGADIARRLAAGAIDGERSPLDLLSPRELEVAALLCQGLRMTDIARRLSLSAKTIATHKYRVYDKLGVRDEVSLARLASQYGMLDPKDRIRET